MASVNRVILIGNLGSVPELKHLSNGRAVCNFSLATNEVWKDKAGAKQEKVEWHKIVIWGDQAENCAKYLSKGRSVYLEGKLQTSMWEKDGQKHYKTEVVAERVVFLGGGGDNKDRNERPQSSQSRQSNSSEPSDDHVAGVPYDNDDIPF